MSRREYLSFMNDVSQGYIPPPLIIGDKGRPFYAGNVFLIFFILIIIALIVLLVYINLKNRKASSTT